MVEENTAPIKYRGSGISGNCQITKGEPFYIDNWEKSDAPHSWLFLKWPQNPWADCAEILGNLWGILCKAFEKKTLSGSGNAKDLSHHKRNSLRLRRRFFTEIVFSATSYHWPEWRQYAWFRSGDDHIWPLTMHVIFRRSSAVNAPGWRHTCIG